MGKQNSIQKTICILMVTTIGVSHAACSARKMGRVRSALLSASPTPSPSATATPSPSATATPSPSATATPSPSATATPTSLTITFNDLANQDVALNGQYPQGVINWGNTNVWFVSAPFGQFGTKSLTYNGAGITSGSIQILSGGVLTKIDAFNGGSVSSTVTIVCAGNTGKQFVVGVGQLVSINTGFVNACTSITLGSSNGWDTNFDNLVLTGGSAPAPAPSPSATPTPTPTPSASPPAPTSVSVTSTSGTFNHRAQVTIAGSGFGSKAQAAPVIWDDASGADINDKWTDAWPNNNPAYNLTYRAQQRGISMPHNHVTKYIAGAHGDSQGANGGYAVVMFKTRVINSFPAYSYISFYTRTDDAWSFGDDDNFKTFAYSEGDGPYNMPNNWYLNYNTSSFSSRTSVPNHQLNDDSNFNTLMSPDMNGHRHWWEDGVNPAAGQWIKWEFELKYTSATNGYIKFWENGVLAVDYAGSTDRLPGTLRTEGIGGYARNYGKPSNWRYFSDVYLDYSRARVILANAPTLDASTIREPQLPSAWSPMAISISVNLGKFTNGQTAYLYVFDSNGVANANGYPITVGQ